MIKAIIFDVDGVLLDSLYIWKEIGKRIVRSYEKTPDENLGDILFPMSFTQSADYMIKTYDLNADVQEIICKVKLMVQNFYYDEVQPKLGVGELLKELYDSGIKMNVATTSNKDHVSRALERNGLSKYLGEVVTVEEVGKSKHEPDVYLKAAEYLGFEINEIAVFEDSLVGAKTAKNAGFYVVGVYDGLGETDQIGLKAVSDIYVESYDKLDVKQFLNL